ncbi:MAG: hypothetical protein ABEH66_01730 [Halobacteriales archaeon]
MADALTVRLNQDGPQSIEAPGAFEATGDFDVVFENVGEPLHAHVGLDPALSGVATVRTPNRFVEEGATRRVRIDVDRAALPVEGRLELVTGYGATTEYVPVTLRNPAEADPGVTVDERLGQPQSAPAEPLVDAEELPRLAFLGVAALLGVLVALVSGDTLVTAGVLVVLVGIAVAGFLLVE